MGDLQIEDDLAKAQKALLDLKSKISSQSKKNFVVEKDVRYLDSRIALLIQNRMALEEQNEVASHLEDATDMQEGFFPNDEKTQKYGNLLFLLQSEPRHIAHLCRLVTMAEIDSLLQTVMFTIYGNQYESREEHLLLTMFQSVLTYQFDNTPEYSSLLRANTPVSRMMTTYTRRGPGQSYLKTVLADRINGLIELKDLDLEINPLKVYERMIEQIEEDTGSLPASLPRGVTAEQAAENSQVQAITEPRLTMLMEIANGFLTTIIDGLEETPYGIRWICKQIRSLTKRKFLMPMIRLYALSLAVSSSCDSSTRPLSRRSRTCSLTATQLSALGGPLPTSPRCCRTWPTSRRMPKSHIWLSSSRSCNPTRTGSIASCWISARYRTSTTAWRWTTTWL